MLYTTQHRNYRLSISELTLKLNDLKWICFNTGDFLYMEGGWVGVCVWTGKRGGGLNDTHSMREQYWKGQNNDTADLHWGGFTTQWGNNKNVSVGRMYISMKCLHILEYCLFGM